MSQSGELNAQHVANYLQQYPDFFNDYQGLLETLAIPHPDTGNVVSLTARQLEVYRHKQRELKTQLNSLLEIARENDFCAGRMHQLTLALLEAETLETAIANLKSVLINCFLTDFVALKIIHACENTGLADVFISAEHENLHHLTAELTHQKPRCGRLNAAQNKFFFADAASEVKSCAIIPIFAADLTGVLVIGSRDEQRFHYSMGDLFLTQLSEILAVRFSTLLK